MSKTLKKYIKIMRKGLPQCDHLGYYLVQAIENEEDPIALVSSVDRNDWPLFRAYDAALSNWVKYTFTMNEQGTKFDLYRIYGIDRTEVAEVPIIDVLPPDIIKKYRFPNIKLKKNKPKSREMNTHKTASKSTTRTRKTSRKSKSSKKGSSSRRKRAKK